MPGRVSELDEKNIQYLGEVIISILQIANGNSKSAVVGQWGKSCQDIIEKAVFNILNKDNIPKVAITPINQEFTAKDVEENGRKGFFRRIFGK